MKCESLVTYFIAASSAVSAADVSIYFGNGCFFHVQHLMWEFESKILQLQENETTSVSGYAGGKAADTLCYHNANDFSDYGDLGHAEVASLTLSEEHLGPAATVFFRDFTDIGDGVYTRQDVFDLGGEYRRLVLILMLMRCSTFANNLTLEHQQHRWSTGWFGR